MDRAIYVAMTASQQAMDSIAIHANNLANATTTGFAADFAQARSVSVDSGGGLGTRAYSIPERSGTNFSRGTLMETGSDLDIAVGEGGWIAVLAPDGSEAYTRVGSLKISPLGQLLTGNDLPVLGNGGPISIPPAAKIQFGGDGSITIQPLGQSADALSTVDRIKLVKPDYADLVKGQDGLIRRKDGQEEEADAAVTIQSGFLESSNVNTVNELTSIMALSRQFELNVKLMSTVKENSAAAARVLQVG